MPKKYYLNATFPVDAVCGHICEDCAWDTGRIIAMMFTDSDGDPWKAACRCVLAHPERKLVALDPFKNSRIVYVVDALAVGGYHEAITYAQTQLYAAMETEGMCYALPQI